MSVVFNINSFHATQTGKRRREHFFPFLFTRIYTTIRLSN